MKPRESEIGLSPLCSKTENTAEAADARFQTFHQHALVVDFDAPAGERGVVQIATDDVRLRHVIRTTRRCSARGRRQCRGERL